MKRNLAKRINLEKLDETVERNKKKFKANIEALNDKNIESQEVLITPKKLKQELEPYECDKIHELVLNTREAVENILARNGKDNRLICIVGPCSIHNYGEAIDYAKALRIINDNLKDRLLLIMRVYFEKPRTIDGWKGFINDPNLDGTYNINVGLRKARRLLIEINKLGIPCGCELLDTISPQYIADLISWGAIGARTCESQLHRQMVSGLSMPIGYKNSTMGDLAAPVNSMLASSRPHSFIGVNENGQAVLCKTNGNKATHIILRGSKYGPNYRETTVMEVTNLLAKNSLQGNVMIDCSHGNSSKNHKNQSKVIENIIQQFANNKSQNRDRNIVGIMLESNIHPGKQNLIYNQKPIYGVSITDSCIGINETSELLKKLYINVNL